MVDVSIPTREDSLLRVIRVHSERPLPGPKLVRVIQMFLWLLSTFLLTPLTLMLRTSWLQDSSMSAAHIVVKYDGVDGGGGAGGKPVKKSSKVEELSWSPIASKV